MPVALNIKWDRRRSLGRAFYELEKAARWDMREIKKGFVKGTKLLQDVIARETASMANISIRDAKRRIHRFKSRRAANAFAGISVSKRGNIIHAGRRKGVRVSAKGRILSIPGMEKPEGAYLFNRKRFTGKKKRVYHWSQGDLKSVNTPGEIAPLFERVGRPIAEQIIATVLKDVSRRSEAKHRASFGHVRGQVGRL